LGRQHLPEEVGQRPLELLAALALDVRGDVPVAHRVMHEREGLSEVPDVEEPVERLEAHPGREVDVPEAVAYSLVLLAEDVDQIEERMAGGFAGPMQTRGPARWRGVGARG